MSTATTIGVADMFGVIVIAPTEKAWHESRLSVKHETDAGTSKGQSVLHVPAFSSFP